MSHRRAAPSLNADGQLSRGMAWSSLAGTLCLVRGRRALPADRVTVRGAQPGPRSVDQLAEPLSLEQRRGTCARAGRRPGEGCSLAPTGQELASLSHRGGQGRGPETPSLPRAHWTPTGRQGVSGVAGAESGPDLETPETWPQGQAAKLGMVFPELASRERGARRARSSVGFPLPPLKLCTGGVPQYGVKWTANGDIGELIPGGSRPGRRSPTGRDSPLHSRR